MSDPADAHVESAQKPTSRGFFDLLGYKISRSETKSDEPAADDATEAADGQHGEGAPAKTKSKYADRRGISVLPLLGAQ